MTWLQASAEEIRNIFFHFFKKNTGDTLNLFIPHISFEIYVNS